ncbi:MAG: aminopeptidase P family protein [Alicyclobacillus sp.]|nr:aminopeptidase P family protein [Alicyclobacillus sp.]
MDASLFTKRRQHLATQLDDGAALVLFAGRAPHRSADSYYEFTPDRNFYYLTGIDRENVIFLLVKRGGAVEETLFIEHTDELAAKWVGARMTPEEAEAASGIGQIRYLEEFDDTFGALFRRSPIDKVYLCLPSESWATPHSPAHAFARQLRERLPHLPVDNAFPAIVRLRAVKSAEELDEIRKAADITREGVLNMYRNVRPGMYEYQLQAYFDFALKQRGTKEHAFPPIVAGGPRATVLHYVDNDEVLEDGQLVLTDLGAAHGYYSSDVTRTFPVNGKFTPRQREIYEIVLKAEIETMAAVKPGMTLKALNDITRSILAEGLKRIGKIQQDDELQAYYYHSVSHSLGLDTHDVWDARMTIQPGAVITIEPGLYLEDEGIGIRIEDDVVVTESGCEILTPGIPKTVEEIEAAIANR